MNKPVSFFFELYFCITKLSLQKIFDWNNIILFDQVPLGIVKSHSGVVKLLGMQLQSQAYTHFLLLFPLRESMKCEHLLFRKRTFRYVYKIQQVLVTLTAAVIKRSAISV